MLKKKLWGNYKGENVYLYTLKNANGMMVTVSNFGATLTSILIPDGDKYADVVLGYNGLRGYADENTAYVGCVVAPNGNRIARGRCLIEGREYHLDVNNGVNNLHTHFELGASKQLMAVEESDDRIVFCCHFADMSAGLPGERDFSVSYQLDDDNRLIITYSMHSDRTTIFNPTHHSYFNLAGHDQGSVFEQKLQLNADYYTPVDETLIPTGEIRKVEDSPFDFRKAKAIGQDFDLNDEQLRIGKGYDHNFVLNDYDGTLRCFGSLKDEKSGREMRCYTTQPGVQVYTANYLERTDGKEGVHYHPNDGICLETQYFPDNINQSAFISSILPANKTTEYQTVYQFRWK